MENPAFGKLVARLIRNRQELRSIEEEDRKIANQVKTEMERRKIRKFSSTAGSITVFKHTTMKVDPRDLFKEMGEEAFDYFKTRLMPLRAEIGDDIVEDLGTVDRTQTCVRTRPI